MTTIEKRNTNYDWEHATASLVNYHDGSETLLALKLLGVTHGKSSNLVVLGVDMS